jgi:hypothetical protein
MTCPQKLVGGTCPAGLEDMSISGSDGSRNARTFEEADEYVLGEILESRWKQWFSRYWPFVSTKNPAVQNFVTTTAQS